MLNAGASGYLLKDCTLEELVDHPHRGDSKNLFQRQPIRYAGERPGQQNLPQQLAWMTA
jgi:hypothetical protein